MPIKTRAGRVVGTFGTYFRETRPADCRGNGDSGLPCTRLGRGYRCAHLSRGPLFMPSRFQRGCITPLGDGRPPRA